MSLYLKYRPQNLASVVGQQHIVSTLRNALARNAITHAYLFSGPRGTGKTSFARILAKAINCLDLKEGSEPCDQCSSCVSIMEGRLVDLIEIDAASNRGIDEIRDLKEKIQFAPTQAKAKVYIIDEVHMLTKEAFNALLKTLEEPPAHAYFILATTEIHKIPETILSRCQQFSFRRITEDDIVTRLAHIAATEGAQAEPEAVRLIARISNGGLRDAIGLLEQMMSDGSVKYDEVVSALGISGPMLVRSFFEALVAKDAAKAIAMVGQVNSMGQSLPQFLREFVGFLREQMLLGLQSKSDVGELLQWIEIFGEAKQQLGNALIPQLPLEVAVLKACGFHKPEIRVEAPTAMASVAKVMPVAQKGADARLVASTEVDPAAVSITIDEVRRNWQKVAEKIVTPAIRMPFLDGEPLEIEKGSLKVGFRSSTLMEKIANPRNQVEVQNAFQSVLNAKLHLRLEIKKINLEPMTAKLKPEEVSMVEMAKEAFGG